MFLYYRRTARTALRRAHPRRPRKPDFRPERPSHPPQTAHRSRQRPYLARRRPHFARQRRHRRPDILANAGGVIVSYFEWGQGRDEYFWSADEVWTIASCENVDLRLAPYIVSRPAFPLHRAIVWLQGKATPEEIEKLMAS